MNYLPRIYNHYNLYNYHKSMWGVFSAYFFFDISLDSFWHKIAINYVDFWTFYILKCKVIIKKKVIMKKATLKTLWKRNKWNMYNSGWWKKTNVFFITDVKYILLNINYYRSLYKQRNYTFNEMFLFYVSTCI